MRGSRLTENDLQSQSKNLLSRLKATQSVLHTLVNNDNNECVVSDKTSDRDLRLKARENLTKNSSLKKIRDENRPKICRHGYEKCLICFPVKLNSEMTVDTPKTTRRRIIDRNILVDEKDVNVKPYKSGLDSFSQYDYAHSLLNNKELTSADVTTYIAEPQDELNDAENNPSRDEYRKKLHDAGNSRQVSNFIKDTTQPKSILNATTSRDYNKSSSKVSFMNSVNSSDSSFQRSKKLWDNTSDERRLLGYDWIAALMENDQGTINQSQNFFEELKEFRKANRQECVNDFYVNGPMVYEDLQKTEPEIVTKAINEPKVKPYSVNERLFTVPLKKPSFTGEDDGSDVGEKEGTRDNPRFVRVSIPRSTLSAPHRVKPHRRRSFDPTDSVALGEHCLLGWENSCPSMLPQASNIGISDDAGGFKSTLATTLADAERLAAQFHRPFSTSDTSTNDRRTRYFNQPLYRDTPLDNSSILLNRTVNQSTNPPVSQDIKRRTDELLDTTYSLMFELDRLRQEREMSAPPNVKSKA